MTTRHYSSFLLRFWLITEPENEVALNSMAVQIQHLQTGETWRLNNLQELNEFLTEALVRTDNTGVNTTITLNTPVE